MQDAILVIRDALRSLWDNLFLIVFCSLVWLFLVMLIIPGPPATVALFYVADQIVDRAHLLDFGDYLRAIMRYFWLGWRWGLVNLVAVGVLLVDVRVIPQILPVSVAVPVQLAVYMALGLWLVINLFALAFLFQQKELSVRQALRNGGVLLLKHPLFSFVLVSVVVFLLWLSVLLVIVNFLFGPMFVALVSTHAVADRLAIFRAARAGASPTSPE